MKKSLIWLLVIAILLIVGGLWSTKKPNSGPASTSNEPIKIGQMSGLTGVGSDIGQEERNGVLLAVEEINAGDGIGGRVIQMISEDSPALDLKQGAAVAKKLMTIDNVLAIF